MLAFQSAPTSEPKTLQPNLLPCQIHHSGPIPIAQRYWNPQPHTNTNSTSSSSSSSNTQTTHLRGRKLHGRTIPLPANYTGVLAQKTTIPLPESKPPSIEDDDEGEQDHEEPIPTHILSTQATFTALTIWNHESLPVGEEDVYMRGLQEWVGVAESIHAYNNDMPAGREGEVGEKAGVAGATT